MQSIWFFGNPGGLGGSFRLAWHTVQCTATCETNGAHISRVCCSVGGDRFLPQIHPDRICPVNAPSLFQFQSTSMPWCVPTTIDWVPCVPRLFEAGGTVFNFFGEEKGSTLRTSLRILNPGFYWKVGTWISSPSQPCRGESCRYWLLKKSPQKNSFVLSCGLVAFRLLQDKTWALLMLTWMGTSPLWIRKRVS